MPARVVVIFLSLMMSACSPPQTMVYEPSNWQRKADEETAWSRRCLGVEVTTYRTIVEDTRARSFRLELEAVNTNGGDVVLAEATLQTGGRDHPGEMVRLFSPEGQVVRTGEYAEFAAVFEFGKPVREALGREIKLQFKIERSAREREYCRLRLTRADSNASDWRK